MSKRRRVRCPRCYKVPVHIGAKHQNGLLHCEVWHCENCGHTYERTPRRPFLERFWEKVDQGHGCWEWNGKRSWSGYGMLAIPRAGKRNPQSMAAHRIAWELTRGPIPDGLCVLHSCDNRACCNPDHLWLGTQQENMADMRRKGRQHDQKPRSAA